MKYKHKMPLMEAIKVSEENIPQIEELIGHKIASIYHSSDDNLAIRLSEGASICAFAGQYVTRSNDGQIGVMWEHELNQWWTPVDSRLDVCELYEKMVQVTGMSMEQLMKSRRYPIPYYRGMIAEYLRNSGYSYPEIGAMLKREHSTICAILPKLSYVVSSDIRVAEVYRDFKTLVAEN